MPATEITRQDLSISQLRAEAARIDLPLRAARGYPGLTNGAGRRHCRPKLVRPPYAAQGIEFSTNLAESFVEGIARATHRADGILFRLH